MTSRPELDQAARDSLGRGPGNVVKRLRRPLRNVGGLTVASLWASGTTYLVFLLFARRADHVDLGRYVAVSGLVLLVTQLLDGGTGLLMVRDVAQARRPSEAAALMALTLRRRLVALLFGLPAVLVIAQYGFQVSGSALVATACYLLGSVGYGYAVQVLQARQRFVSLMGYQAVNGALFVVVGGVAMLRDWLPLWLMLGVPAIALMSLTMAAVPMIGRSLKGRSSSGSRGRELWMVRVGSAAASLTANADTLLLGAISPRVTAIYAGSQRPALGLSAVSSALMNVLLPKVSGVGANRHRVIVRVAAVAALPVAIAGAALGWLLTPLLSAAYSDPSLARPAVLSLLLAGYGLGALSSAPVSVLYAQRRGDLVAVLTASQAILVLAGCAFAAMQESAVGVAVAVATGKTLYLALALLMTRRQGRADTAASMSLLERDGRSASEN